MNRNEDVEKFEAGISSENGRNIEEPQAYQDMGIPEMAQTSEESQEG